MGYGIRLIVRGQRACFTRPEMKAERVSYDVITPSAARGLLEAVYWKPAIKWIIDSIEVLNEIKFDTFRRNEVGSKLSYRNARSAMNTDAPIHLAASDNKQRAQRATLMLKDVAYVITAHFALTEKAELEDTKEKHYNIALRRLKRGQCFNQPYLGCREFPARVELLESDEPELASFYAETGKRDLGYMLFDIDFEKDMQPIFYRATMVDGVITVPQPNEKEAMRT